MFDIVMASVTEYVNDKVCGRPPSMDKIIVSPDTIGKGSVRIPVTVEGVRAPCINTR
jgi:hypothetical protein